MLVYLNYSDEMLETELALEKGSLDIKRQADGKTYQLVKSRGWTESYTYTEYLKNLSYIQENSANQNQDKYDNAFEQKTSWDESLFKRDFVQANYRDAFS